MRSECSTRSQTQTRVDRQANLTQRALIAGKSLATRIGTAGINQAGDATVALLNQIAGGHIAAHLVVEHHLVALEPLNGTVDHYGRDGQVADFFAQGAIIGELVTHHQEDAINAARHQLAQQLQIVIGASARAGNEERIAVLAAALFQATGERGKKRLSMLGTIRPSVRDSRITRLRAIWLGT